MKSGDLETGDYGKKLDIWATHAINPMAKQFAIQI